MVLRSLRTRVWPIVSVGWSEGGGGLLLVLLVLLLVLFAELLPAESFLVEDVLVVEVLFASGVAVEGFFSADNAARALNRA